MSGVGAAIAVAVSPSAANAAKKGHNPPNVGSGTLNLRAEVFPISQPSNRGPYPEQALARYSAADGKWGVAFSGGGSRSFSATLGQMRALENAGVLDNIGAISCVSGASWFGTPFTFAPRRFLDSTLLGPLVQPADITVDGLTQIAEDCLGARITNLTDANLLAILALELVQIIEFQYIPPDKLYSRALNDAFLLPYGLNNTDTLFTLNEESLQAIRARNPGLKAPFYLPRKGRPFLILGGTQIYQPSQPQQTPVTQPVGPAQVFHSVEYTPLYSGAAQLVDQGAPTGLSYGGGYVESFAFDTPAPTARRGNVAIVPQGQYPFLLSDMMGSSSASVANLVEQQIPAQLAGLDPYPSFDYWPVTKSGPVEAMEYDFGDGGILDDTGVVSLLRRGYRTIFAFVNSSVPINSVSDLCVDGIDGQISRLFGLIPAQTNGNAQSTQVFATAQYQPVVNGLKAARAAGDTPVYARPLSRHPGKRSWCRAVHAEDLLDLQRPHHVVVHAAAAVCPGLVQQPSLQSSGLPELRDLPAEQGRAAVPDGDPGEPAGGHVGLRRHHGIRAEGLRVRCADQLRGRLPLPSATGGGMRSAVHSRHCEACFHPRRLLSDRRMDVSLPRER